MLFHRANLVSQADCVRNFVDKRVDGLGSALIRHMDDGDPRLFKRVEDTAGADRAIGDDELRLQLHHRLSIDCMPANGEVRQTLYRREIGRGVAPHQTVSEAKRVDRTTECSRSVKCENTLVVLIFCRLRVFQQHFGVFRRQVRMRGTVSGNVVGARYRRHASA